MTDSSINETLWDYYRSNARDLPWRQAEIDGTYDPYKILVSEVMLQQTQVSRVIPKYQQFLSRFPDMASLADAALKEILLYWQGLGYNRRAIYLHNVAKSLNSKPFPQTIEELTKHKGVGANTAAAVLVYAFNQPLIFIETNVRTVFLELYFIFENEVHDTQILEAVRECLDRENPREWYWAVMDYGAYLKANKKNHLHRATNYKKQSPFEGSLRQVRGRILRLALEEPTIESLSSKINDMRFLEVLDQLQQEGLVAVKDGRVVIADNL